MHILQKKKQVSSPLCFNKEGRLGKSLLQHQHTKTSAREKTTSSKRVCGRYKKKKIYMCEMRCFIRYNSHDKLHQVLETDNLHKEENDVSCGSIRHIWGIPQIALLQFYPCAFSRSCDSLKDKSSPTRRRRTRSW